MFSQKLEIESIISRMKIAVEARNDSDLARFFGSKSTGYVSNWRKKGEIPEGNIALIAVKRGVTFDWLMTGEGEMLLLYGVAENQEEYAGRLLSEDEDYLLRTFRKLHLAEKEKVIEIAELYSGVKESRKHDGGGSGSQESNSN
jgi:hypothetical protein